MDENRKRWMLQKQNSVTKKWMDDGNYDTFGAVEARYDSKIAHEDCARYSERWRMIEISVVHGN